MSAVYWVRIAGLLSLLATAPAAAAVNPLADPVRAAACVHAGPTQ